MSPNLAVEALHSSCRMFSTMAFVLPYADSGCKGEVSGIGIVVGVPYTVALDEKTKFLHPCAAMLCPSASSRERTRLKTNLEE